MPFIDIHGLVISFALPSMFHIRSVLSIRDEFTLRVITACVCIFILNLQPFYVSSAIFTLCMLALRHHSGFSFLFSSPDSERYVWRVDSFGLRVVSVGFGWFCFGFRVAFGFWFCGFGGFLGLLVSDGAGVALQRR